MKKLTAILFLFGSCICLAQKNPPRLIVRGDDMGYSHSGNLALIKSSKEGIQQSIEVIVPSPWFPEAVRLLNENPGIDVGVHIAITSEWDNVKWRPLTDAPSLRNEDGYFYPMIRPNPNYPNGAVRDHAYSLDELEKEMRAQIELAMKRIPSVSHISGHMGSTGLDDKVRVLSQRLAEEYGINVDMSEVKGARYNGPSETSDEKIESFIAMLNGLKPGTTYLFVDHPGLNNEELQAVHHIGYEDVAIDRQGVTDTWTNEKVKAAIEELGIELISYADLKIEQEMSKK